MTAVFSVKTPTFEGPLDLLLNLIEDRKMLISDVSLSEVADTFLAYLSNQTEFPLHDTAQFIVVAATLLLIKSRALLPVLTLTDDEEGDIVDLERRLALLKIMRDAAKALAVSRARMYFAEGARVKDPIFVPPPDLATTSLHSAMRDVLNNAPKFVKRDEVVVDAVVSLDEMIDRLTVRVQKAIALTFSQFTEGATNPRDIVVGFLAMLELVKRGFANVNQNEQFDEITIEYAGSSGTPRYD
jgi:segregation and condensation protein A